MQETRNLFWYSIKLNLNLYRVEVSESHLYHFILGTKYACSSAYWRYHVVVINLLYKL